jgi:non-homologous end joining protein Ku
VRSSSRTPILPNSACRHTSRLVSKKNYYILLSDTGFESVKVESFSTMTIEKFVENNSIDLIYFNSSYYFAPDDTAGRDVYAVQHEVISAIGRVALSRVIIGQRERTQVCLGQSSAPGSTVHIRP